MFIAVKNYFIEAVHEMRKVTWPTKKQLQNYTILVILMSAGMAVFLGFLDYFLSQGLSTLLAR